MGKKKEKPEWIWERPMDEFERIRKEFFRPFRFEFPVFREVVEIPITMSETEKELIVRAELPGFKKNEVSLNVSEDSVSISAEKRHEEIERGERIYRQEISRKSVHRTFSLPVKIDPERTEAKMEEGILTITMPKLAPGRITKKKVEIK
jgi:HSP20 family protein